jgi:hypothetical protein
MASAVEVPEQRFFRVAIIVAVLGVIGFGIPTLQERRHFRLLNAADTQVEEELNDTTYILSPKEFDLVSHQKSRIETRVALAETRYHFLRWVTWLLPLIAFGVFYIGRWAILGRWRPLWPLSS